MGKSSLVINVSPETAFAYLSDFSRHHEWAQNPMTIETEPGSEAVSGSTFSSHGRQFGQQLHDDLTVTANEPGRRFAFEARGRGGVFRHAFSFEQAPAGTRVTKEMIAVEMPFPFSLVRWLSDPFLARRMAVDLRRIRAQLEKV